MATIRHYTGYRPRPFTPAERKDVTVLLGGLTWKHERLVQGAFENMLVTDLEYRTRPYEVVPGATDRVLAESIEHLYEAFRNRPRLGGKAHALGWHLLSRYFVQALRGVKRLWDTIEVDRLRVKPKVKITGEFWLQTHEGDGNYDIKRWLEREGAEVIPPPVAVWLDYLIHLNLQQLTHLHHVQKLLE